jgi:hypothetical protein
MEHECLEFKIVMEDGPDLEVLARVSALDIAGSAYMASIAKYPKRTFNCAMVRGSSSGTTARRRPHL